MNLILLVNLSLLTSSELPSFQIHVAGPTLHHYLGKTAYILIAGLLHGNHTESEKQRCVVRVMREVPGKDLVTVSCP